jgi:DNA-binding response OmpR family regulator
MQLQTQTDSTSAAEFTTIAQYFDTSNKRILIVEDDEIIRAIVSHAIGQLGYDVDTAENGELAWEKLNLQNYDLLITDNNMPRLTGLELVELVRAARMTLPVILASGGTSHVDPALQISAMLPKPFYTEQLVKIVRDVLAKTAIEADYCQFFTATLANLRCANKA